MPRPRKPAAAKIAAGEPGKREVAEPVEAIAASRKAPAWVAAIPLALEQWNGLVDERIRLGIHTALTVDSFGRLCVLMAAFRLVLLKVNAEDLATKKGDALATLLDLEKCIKPLETEMGGTPKSQNSLDMAPPAGPANPAEQKFKAHLSGAAKT